MASFAAITDITYTVGSKGNKTIKKTLRVPTSKALNPLSVELSEWGIVIWYCRSVYLMVGCHKQHRHWQVCRICWICISTVKATTISTADLIYDYPTLCLTRPGFLLENIFFLNTIGNFNWYIWMWENLLNCVLWFCHSEYSKIRH